MVLNPYFQQGARSEQNLVQDLINEQLRMYGIEVHYLPRKYVTENKVIREVVSSKFDDAYPIEAYVDTFDGYGNDPVLMSKFGIQQTNEITISISRERFENYISPLMKNEADVKLTTRPKEGDLIYFPLGDRLFEIKFVEFEKPFYQLQKNYIYELRCELFRYEDEIIDTGVDEIDNELVGDNLDGDTEDGIPTILGPTQTFTLVGVGITAAAETSIIASGAIRFVDITNRGGGYINSPTVGFSSAPSGGVTGIATVRMIGGIVACNKNVNAKARSVQNIDLVNPGSGYTVAPLVQVSGGGGTGAAGTAYIGNGTVGVVTLTAAGSGFTTAPTVVFSGPAGVGTTATAVAIISAGGTITSINITNAGAGYTTIPSIAISDPSMDSTGDYIFNEQVKGDTSDATGRVRSWNSSTNILEVASINGTFALGEKIIGQTSLASHALRVVDEEPTDDGYADNFNIETEADKILDFTEQNPFGIP
jgi:hypothetical protein